MTTAERLKNVEERISTAQSALDKAQSGIHAAGEVAVAVEKARRHPALLVLGLVAIIGVVWMIVHRSERN